MTQPYGHPPQGYGPPSRRRLPWWAIALITIATLFGVMIACTAIVASTVDTGQLSAGTDASGTPASGAPTTPGIPTGPLQHPEDVEITSCGVSTVLSLGEAEVKVVNQSSKASAYSIEVTIESADGSVLYGVGRVFIPRLEPGQTKADTAHSLDEVPEGATVRCRLTDATRTAA